MIPTKPSPEDEAPSAPEPSEPAAPDPHQEALRARLKTAPTATVWLLAAIVVVYLLEMLLGGGDSLPVLAALGGLSRDAVLVDHQVWRVVSHSFVHAGLLHVAMNGWVLFVVGARVEQMLGTARVLVLYTASVIGGGLMTLATSEATITVGASGGLFGLLAAEAIFVFTSRSHLLPPNVRAARQRAAVINLMLNLGISLQPHISLSAHAGGAIVGATLMLLGFAPAASDTNTTTPALVRALALAATATLIAGLVGGVGFSGAMALHAGPHLVRRDVPELGWSVEVPDALPRSGPSGASGAMIEVAFGDLERDPALVAVARVPRDEVSTPETDEAQMRAIDEVLRTPPEQGAFTSATRTTVGERPAILARYTYPSGLVLLRLVVVRTTDLARIETLVWEPFEPGYAEATQRIGASIQTL